MTNFLIDYKSIEDDIILIDSRSMSDPNLSDIDFENKMTWVWSPDSGLPLTIRISKTRLKWPVKTGYLAEN